MGECRGIEEPVTSYLEHYPGHAVEPRRCADVAAPAHGRFDADSEYDREFGWKTGEPRTVPFLVQEPAAAEAGTKSAFMVRCGTSYTSTHPC